MSKIYKNKVLKEDYNKFFSLLYNDRYKSSFGFNVIKINMNL